MIDVKRTERSCVRIGYAGTVHKHYFGHAAKTRMENEVRVLEYLRQRNCPFVPRLLEADREDMKIVMTHCGYAIQQLSEDRLNELFEELREYGVEHEDQHVRNITYCTSAGRFFVVDFEFASILEHPSIERIEDLQRVIARELAGLDEWDEQVA